MTDRAKRGERNQSSPAPAPATEQHEPSIAAGIENDALDVNATSEEIERGDSTLVTRLAVDWSPDE